MRLLMKTMLLMLLSFTAFTTVEAAAPVAEQCPKLSGRFLCPAHGANPAFQMQVTQLGSVRRTVSYSWNYFGGFQDVGYFASVRGVRNPNGVYGVCRNNGLYLSQSLQDLSASMRNEVTATGNYVITTFMGEPYLTCVPARR
jgi:hypothetical protein